MLKKIIVALGLLLTIAVLEPQVLPEVIEEVPDLEVTIVPATQITPVLPEPVPEVLEPLSELVPVLSDVELVFQEMQVKYNLTDEDMETLLKIAWNESRHTKYPPDNYNTNGTVDTGFMQINSCNWEWMAKEGLDVHRWEDNIECGVLLYSKLRETRSVEAAVAAYQAGTNYTSTEYSRFVVSLSLEEFMEVVK